jgi:hypothetical protein
MFAERKNRSNPVLNFLIFNKERTLKLKLMFIKSLIEEIVGISILLGRTTNPEVLTALESMDKNHVKEYRDSLAEEFRILRPNVHLLLEEEGV